MRQGPRTCSQMAANLSDRPLLDPEPPLANGSYRARKLRVRELTT